MPSPKEDAHTVPIASIFMIKTLTMKLSNQTGESANTLGHRKDATVGSHVHSYMKIHKGSRQLDMKKEDLRANY